MLLRSSHILYISFFQKVSSEVEEFLLNIIHKMFMFLNI